MMKTAHRMKEDERIEGIIRGLLKLPENRRCINCNSLGPQYVCTTFLTFVCTNCSGVHREFTHRVKSVSMAKFTAEEVSALQAAGNERARQIYLKDWDPHRNSYPDGSNLHRLRDFIKHVYVDRKYTGEKIDNLPRLRLGEREESFESRKVRAHLGEFRSPRYESRYEQSSSGRSYPGRRSDNRSSRYYHDERSPEYNHENARLGGYRKTPARIEIVDNRFRDDTSRSVRRSENRNFTNREYRSGSKSPDRQTNKNISTSSVVQPIKEILGENAPRLEISQRSKAIESNDAHDGSANNQKIVPSGGLLSVDGNPVENAASSSLLSVDGNSVEHKKKNSKSLINLSTDPEPPDAAVAQPQMQSISPPGDCFNHSSNEHSAKETATMPPVSNTLEFLIFELSAPMVAQGNDDARSTVEVSNMSEGAVPSAVPSMQMSTSPTSVTASATASTTNIAMQPSGDFGASSSVPLGQISTLPSVIDAFTSASTANMLVHPSEDNAAVSGVSPLPPSEQMMALHSSVGDSPTVSTTTMPVSPLHGDPTHAAPDNNVESVVQVPDVQQLSSIQTCEPSPSFAADSRSSTAQQIPTPVGAVKYQTWISSLVPNTQGPSTTSAEQSSETVSKAVQNTCSRVGSEPLPVETKSSGRKELPVDLFTASYLPGPSPVPHWQSCPPHAIGLSMQYYPNAMLVPAYSNPAKPSNPFEINSETDLMQLPQLPEVPQFPSMASLQGALPNGNLLHASNAGAHSLGLMMPQTSSFASAIHPQTSHMSSSALMGQQVQSNMVPSRLQGVDGFGSDRVVLGSSNTPQQPIEEYSVPTTTNSFSPMGGNPFG